MSERLEDIVQDRDVRNGFLAMYAGAHTPATIWNGGMFCGKAECEWIWPEGWRKLRKLGLIEYRIQNVKCHDGAIMKKVHYRTTERGDALRDEYWK